MTGLPDFDLQTPGDVSCPSTCSLLPASCLILLCQRYQALPLHLYLSGPEPYLQLAVQAYKHVSFQVGASDGYLGKEFKKFP